MNDPTITYSLQKTLALILGDNEFVPITEEYADEILLTIKKTPLRDLGYHLQIEPDEDEVLVYPRLWSFRFWAASRDRRLQAKKWSENRRNESFIYEANLKMVTEAIIDELNPPYDMAMIAARKLLRGKHIAQKLKRLGIEKLYTTIDELP